MVIVIEMYIFSTPGFIPARSLCGDMVVFDKTKATLIIYIFVLESFCKTSCDFLSNKSQINATAIRKNCGKLVSQVHN